MQSRYTCSSCKVDFNENDKLPQILDCGHDLCKSCCFGQFIATQNVTCPQCKVKSLNYLNLPVNNALNYDIQLRKDHPYAVPSTCFIHKQRNNYYCEEEQTAICQECIVESKHQDHKILKIEEISNNQINQAAQEVEQIKQNKNYIQTQYINAQRLKEITQQQLQNYINKSENLVSDRICYSLNIINTHTQQFQNQANKIVEQIDLKATSWDIIKDILGNEQFQIQKDPYQIIGLRQYLNKVIEWNLSETKVLKSIEAFKAIINKESMEFIQLLEKQKEQKSQEIAIQEYQIEQLKNQNDSLQEQIQSQRRIKMQEQEEQLKAQQELQKLQEIENKQMEQQQQKQSQEQEQVKGCQVKEFSCCTNENERGPCPKCQRQGCGNCFSAYYYKCKNCKTQFGYFCEPCYDQCYGNGHEFEDFWAKWIQFFELKQK